MKYINAPDSRRTKGRIPGEYMAEPMSTELKEVVRKYALQNAALYGGKANSKAVIGKVLAEQPSLRSRVREIGPVVEEVVTEINALPLEQICTIVEAIDSSLLKKTHCEREHALPDLPNAIQGKVVMRFAPGPSGPLHLGHTRVAILNDEYCRRYQGTYINRMEDTNPEKIDPDAYEMIPEDLKWLGVEVTKTVIQSERFELYYDIARKLIEMGKGYICTCQAESWRKLKEESKACPHHRASVEENLEMFDQMLSHKYAEEEAVMVVKTDLHHPNPAIRDFIGLRIVDSVPHPRTGTRYCVYPMMNFSVAVDDHFLGLTHVIRGKDHLNNTLRQEFIFNYFGWTKPWYHHYGLVSVPDSILKTSTVGKGIKSGEYSGWDDVRLGTVRAMEKRGITPEAIRRFWVECGIKDVDIEFSWDNLYALNKDIVDPIANRYFFVWDPEPLEIFGIDEISSYAPLHPSHPERGTRKLLLNGPPLRVYIPKSDLELLKQNGRLRLKDLCNVELRDGKAWYIGNDLGVLKQGVRIAHWAPDPGMPTEVAMPDGSVRKGFSEPIPQSEEGKVVQFERFGFARIDSIKPSVKAFFAHK